MSYRNIQGMRAIAALMVVSCHMFWSLVPMRTHWAKPFFADVGPAGVDVFFVISGFIIYHVIQRSIASMDQVGRGRAVFTFAAKRFIRIYPLYWIAFAVACLVMVWSPPTALPLKRPIIALLTLVDSIPNYVVGVAWTLTYEVYFYAVAALSLLILGKRAQWGLAIWFSVLTGAAVVSAWHAWSAPLDYLFAPILLEFLLGAAVGMLVERGVRVFHGAMFLVAMAWIAIGTWFVARDPASYPLRVLCWGIPAAVFIYGVATLEVRRRWIMPRSLQYLGDASFSIYLWHVIVFDAMVGAYARLGWVGAVNPAALTALMVAAAMGIGLLSYHYLEKPLLRRLGQWFVGQRVASNALGTEAHAGNLAA
ncbi:acyltransferase family protein [Luteibacter aegosomatissinici]|uniref:acyltransferase family protein n=1 Tax=Luteibacter aegosomatissinici TaxID=2911539 RepID=UPI001FF9688E|nr:acyltransferase [Luteibacter aegosomatissinici]UPG94986.1 acyltransferase [Luteibacter aegosomatissinici]